MIALAWPWVLLALPLPLLMRVLLPARPPTAGVALRLPTLNGLAALAAPAPASRWRQALAALIWLLLVLAAARPQTAGAPLPLPLAGRDLLLAVDISGSMERTDFALGGAPVTRLELVKATARGLIARRPQDRLGLILFASQAAVLTPLTYDHGALTGMLDEAVVGLAGPDTAIGDAIGLAVKRLTGAPPGERVLVLFTDGASNAGVLDPLTAAGLAAAAGIRIHAIGLGQPPGASGAGDDLDPALLRAIAERTGGRAFRASDADQLARVSRLLDQLEPSTRAEQTYRPLRERYAWPAAAALVLAGAVLAFEVLALARRQPTHAV